MNFLQILIAETRYYKNDINDPQKRMAMLKESPMVWQMLDDSYSQIGGYKGAINPSHLVDKSYMWRVVYYLDTPLALGIYKQDHGLKRFGIAVTVDKGYRKYGKDALKKIIKEDFKRAWVESSGQSEKLMMSLGGEKYMIPNTKIKEIMGDEIISLDEDGYHYTRKIMDHEYRKVSIGTIK